MIPSLIVALGVLLETTGDDGLWILLLGPAGAVGVYWGLWQYYRNTGQSHSFERETLIESKPVTGTDRKVNEVKGTRNPSVDGNNVSSYRQRVQRI